MEWGGVWGKERRNYCGKERDWCEVVGLVCEDGNSMLGLLCGVRCGVWVVEENGVVWSLGVVSVLLRCYGAGE